MGAAFSIAPLYSFLPDSRKTVFIDALMAGAMPMVLHRKDRYISILKSTGYSYNKHLDHFQKKYYETQSAPWTCFFADVQAFKHVRLEQEVWLDAHNYSALDDQTMFYKAWLMGKKTITVADAFYEHLDAGTSKRNNKPAVLYSYSFNRVVFWHRFILTRQKTMWGKVFARIAFSYYMICYLAWKKVNIYRGRLRKDDYRICKQGYADGKAYLKKQEYQELPPFC